MFIKNGEIYLHKTTKMIDSPFYTCGQIYFTSINGSFFVVFVCLSVCLFTLYWNVVESLYFLGSYPYTSEWWCNSNIKMIKFKVTDNENVKIVFHAHPCLKWINLRQTKTRIIAVPFYTCRRIHFTSGNASFCDYL